MSPSSPSSAPEPDRRIPVGFDATLGAEFLELSGERVVMRLEVGPHLEQPFGILHGGVYCTLVESSASMGAGAWYATRGHVVGMANQTDFLHPVRGGTVTATATPVHQGRTTQLWEVQIRDQDERLVARGQVRIANLERRD